MASDAADHWRTALSLNKKLLSIRSITNGYRRIAGRLHIPRFGALRCAAERAAVGLASPMIFGSGRRRADRRDDQERGNVIANEPFASRTDLEMTSALALGGTRAVRCTRPLMADFVEKDRQYFVVMAPPRWAGLLRRFLCGS